MHQAIHQTAEHSPSRLPVHLRHWAKAEMLLPDLGGLQEPGL